MNHKKEAFFGDFLESTSLGDVFRRQGVMVVHVVMMMVQILQTTSTNLVMESGHHFSIFIKLSGNKYGKTCLLEFCVESCFSHPINMSVESFFQNGLNGTAIGITQSSEKSVGNPRE